MLKSQKDNAFFKELFYLKRFLFGNDLWSQKFRFLNVGHKGIVIRLNTYPSVYNLACPLGFTKFSKISSFSLYEIFLKHLIHLSVLCCASGWKASNWLNKKKILDRRFCLFVIQINVTGILPTLTFMNVAFSSCRVLR